MSEVAVQEDVVDEPMEAELAVGPKAIDAYSRLSYSMWFALAEFVDNSTQSRLNYDDLIGDVLKSEGAILTVDIVHDRIEKQLTIEDNSIGMSKKDLIDALKIAMPTADSKGRSRYGMGMKTAACWIGKEWSVVTCEWGSGEEWTATVNVDAIAYRGAKVPLSKKPVSRDAHYTKIIIRDLRRVIQKRTEEVIKQYLGSMYMFDLRPNDVTGVPSLKLTYNGEQIAPPDASDWDTDQAGQPMWKQLPEKTIHGKKISGWVGVLRKGGRKFGGFSLFQNERQIQGFPNAWKPRAIFGGVDDEGANNLVAQRLTGVLLLDGFVVSHTKDAVLFEGDEEDEVEKFLVEQTKDYREFAEKRRGTRVKGWSKEKLRDLVETMRPEFESGEVQDALKNAFLPPPETTQQSNERQMKSLTAEQEVSRVHLLPDLEVAVYYTENSEWEPYVTFTTSADGKTLHVIINSLHPYYITLESNDAIEECVRQYIYDAVAEYKTSKLLGLIDPSSVRRLKNELLKAAVTRINNSGVQTRTQAEFELMQDSPAAK